ncbi:hypothetical protein QYM36_009248 [Artemia franciscana]|uniref:Uncharacterized protein n=1 Tax=Artemia franciscana TaxID=6661 RepID=A0AA88I0Y0_ARTSF|nr:hypothetical protein QYM36_009248 [Artemia franciscana]
MLAYNTGWNNEVANIEVVASVQNVKRVSIMYIKQGTRTLQSFSLLLAKRHLLEQRLYQTPEELQKPLCHREKKTARSSKYIGFIATKLRVDTSRSDISDDEWKLKQLDKDPDLAATTRVDEYWVNFFYREGLFGKRKYPKLACVVKVAFFPYSTLSGKIISEQRAAMGERMLIVKLTISDELIKLGTKPKNVPITRDLIKLARGARTSLMNHLEAQCEREKDQ